MKRKPYLRRTFTSIILINLVSLLLLTWFSTSTIREFFVRKTLEDLESSLVMLRPQVLALLEEGDASVVDELCKSLKLRNRITVILPNGHVIGDSVAITAEMESHHDRPEIMDAMAGGNGTSMRFSNTLQRRMLYYARDLRLNNELVGVLRLARPVDAIDSTLMAIKIRAGAAWLLMSLLATLFILNFARRAARPFQNLSTSAERLASGEFEGSLPEPHWEEMGGLARAMNTMASRIDENSTLLDKQRIELEAILSGMSEAVLAVDTEGRAFKINHAMAGLFQIDREHSRGKNVQILIRNQEFIQFIHETLTRESPTNTELTIYSPELRYLLARGTQLRDPDNNVVGAVCVLTNITDLKRLENMRSDFVANVSHELRTPITSIKGFVETMLSDDIADPEDSRRFLEIISRQSERLGNIIEDLLSLSKIEQSQERIKLDLEERNLRDVLQGSIDNLEEKAENKNIRIDLDCPEILSARVHPNLFEQAVVNLVDNAVKYSDAGKEIFIKAYAQGPDKVRLDVIDQGCGIPPSHLERLFERFYRVDRARSRAQGGTGLGLSIVKHIMSAHGGQVMVESELHEGSTFSMIFPV